jgi:hypothetical protein
MTAELDGIINSDRIPNPDNTLHVEAVLAVLGRLATPDDARAVCRQAAREQLSFRQLARLAEQAYDPWAKGHRIAVVRFKRFLRRAFGA